jgi:hypothetical protein
MFNGACPICEKTTILFPRYPHAVCSECSSDTFTADMKPITFHNEGPWGGFVSMVNGTQGESNECFIHGIKCYAEEARMGGIVISKIMHPSDSHQAILTSEDLNLTKDHPT